MVDQLYDRDYQAARRQLNAAALESVSRFRAAVRNSFEVLNRIEYSAPWTSTAKRVRSHRAA